MNNVIQGLSCGFVSLFRSEKVTGVTMLDSYDILWTGGGFELRSGGMQRWSAGADV